MLKKWQEKWNKEENKGQWTKALIKDLKSWTQRTHGRLTYELTQFLSGHGHFRSFQFKIKKVPDENCIFCRNVKDNAEHTIFHCKKFEAIREECTQKEGQLTKDNIIEKMLRREESWKNIEKMIKKIINSKEKEDRASRNVQQVSQS